MTSFPERLALARKKKGHSQGDLAEIMGYRSGKQTLYRWEKGDSEPGISQAIRLAEVLEVPLLWLISGIEPDATVQYTIPPDKVLMDVSEAAELYRIKSQMLEMKLNQSNQ